jgi:hypothetical protein
MWRDGREHPSIECYGTSDQLTRFVQFSYQSTIPKPLIRFRMKPYQSDGSPPDSSSNSLETDYFQ